MSLLAPLLEIQELDLAADAARARSESLPEREALPELDAALVEIEARLRAAEVEREAAETEEEELGRAVAQLARDIEAAEVERYSGKRLDRDEAAAHDASQAALREKQAGLEESELELLESIEAIGERIDGERAAGVANRDERGHAEERIAQVEAEVAAEIARLAEARQGVASAIPDAILERYDKIRANPRLHGRGAAVLAKGSCGGCRVKLPSLENRRMLEEPEEALIQCPQCRRVLVRE